MAKRGSWVATFVQCGLSAILSTSSTMSSSAFVWPSYAIPMLKDDRSPLGYSISEHEGNVISSLPMMGAFISTLLTGYVSEAIGRRRTQIMCGLIYLTAWSLIATAHTAIQTMIGRFIMGLGGGMCVGTCMIYISEISDISNRGSCITISSLMFNVGVLASYIEGWVFSYEVISIINVTVAAGFTIAMCLLKETPPYLLKMGREKEALSSLKFYRGVTHSTEAVLEELAYLKNQVKTEPVDCSEKPILDKEKAQEAHEKSIESAKTKNPFVLLVSLDYCRRAIATVVLFMTLSTGMGMVAVQAYANQLFATAVPALAPDLCAVLLAVVLLCSNVLTVAVTDLFTRRSLMISTSVVSCACLATIGAGLRWPWVPVWVPPVAIIVFCIVYHLGVINLVFIQLSECFGPKVISAATPVMFCSMFIGNFVVLYSFGPIVSHFGIDGAFFIFAIDAAIATVAFALFMKETRRVPLEDIQTMYARGFLCKRL